MFDNKKATNLTESVISNDVSKLPSEIWQNLLDILSRAVSWPTV